MTNLLQNAGHDVSQIAESELYPHTIDLAQRLIDLPSQPDTDETFEEIIDLANRRYGVERADEHAELEWHRLVRSVGLRALFAIGGIEIAELRHKLDTSLEPDAIVSDLRAQAETDGPLSISIYGSKPTDASPIYSHLLTHAYVRKHAMIALLPVDELRAGELTGEYAERYQPLVGTLQEIQPRFEALSTKWWDPEAKSPETRSPRLADLLRSGAGANSYDALNEVIRAATIAGDVSSADRRDFVLRHVTRLALKSSINRGIVRKIETGSSRRGNAVNAPIPGIVQALEAAVRNGGVIDPSATDYRRILPTEDGMELEHTSPDMARFLASSIRGRCPGATSQLTGKPLMGPDGKQARLDEDALAIAAHIAASDIFLYDIWPKKVLV